tara:strand:- start:168 stop:476 length:309 start_codon:yes stop_codon:yes gene_type:complete
MKKLLLLIITIVFSSNASAQFGKLDRKEYNFICDGNNIRADTWGNSKCSKMEKGDVLYDIRSVDAILYCDEIQPTLEDHGGPSTTYTCIYNGKPIKKWKELK